MVLVPVVIAVVVGIGVVTAAWNVLAHSDVGIGVDDSADFFSAATVVSAAADPLVASGNTQSLDENTSLVQMLDASEMTLVVLDGSNRVITIGDLLPGDDGLLAAAISAGGEVELSSEGRCLSSHEVDTPDGVRVVCVLGDSLSGSEAATKWVIVLAAAALLLAVVVIVAVTNRFLTLFVLRHITAPLDLLARGTREIRDGNLSFRLPARTGDEFSPVFDDFNDMALRLADSVERDRRAEERRSTLFIGLSHDLRGPLTSIRAYAEGIEDGIAATPEDKERYAGMIRAKSEEMGALLDRLSLLSRMDGSAERVSLVPADLAQVVDAWAEESVEAYRARGVEVALDQNPAWVRTDATLMARVLNNLVDNCVKYAAGPDGCHVLVRTESGAHGAPVLSVEDDGPGVPEQDRDRLFDMFFRGDEARTSTKSGNGIGLAVVALAMERMGGTAQALGSELGGLKIELRFPRNAVYEEGDGCHGEDSDR